VDSALKSNPDDVPALMVKAVFYVQKPDLTAAENTYESVLKHYPDFSPAQRQLALLYATDAHNDAKTYPLVVKAHDAYPEDPDVSKALGLVLYRQGNYSRAVSVLQEAARRRSTDADLIYHLGLAQYQLKNRAECKTALQQALALNLPAEESSEAKRILAELK
jgi:tetratricopeptide (TPR) repeat protein